MNESPLSSVILVELTRRRKEITETALKIYGLAQELANLDYEALVQVVNGKDAELMELTRRRTEITDLSMKLVADSKNLEEWLAAERP